MIGDLDEGSHDSGVTGTYIYRIYGRARAD